MNTKHLYEYYSFGYNYRLLLEGREGHSIDEVKEELMSHAQFLRENNLQVTIKALGQDIVEFYESLAKKEGGHKFSSEDSAKMVNVLEAAATTLNSELKLREAYILTEKRFDLKKLLDKVDDLFAKDVFPKLPEIARFDFYEAGKCIAFERSTAACFHLLRATESTVREYYNKLMKKKPKLGHDDYRTKEKTP